MKRMINLVTLILYLLITIAFSCNAKELEAGIIERTPENSALIDRAIEYNRERFNSHAWEVLMEKKNKLDEQKIDKITSWEDLERDGERAMKQILIQYEAYRDILKEIPNSKFKDDYIREMEFYKKMLEQEGYPIPNDLDNNQNNAISYEENLNQAEKIDTNKSAVIWSGR